MKSTVKGNKAVLANVDSNINESDLKKEKPKTRKPPSVRQNHEKMQADVRSWLQGVSPLNRDTDALVKQALDGENPFVHSMILQVRGSTHRKQLGERLEHAGRL